MKLKNPPRLVTVITAAAIAAATAGAGQSYVDVGGAPSAVGAARDAPKLVSVDSPLLPAAARTQLLVAQARGQAPAPLVDAFDWGDAGVGAGVVAALALMAGGAIAVRKHRPQRGSLTNEGAEHV